MDKLPALKDVLNVRETAQLLGVHENTVRNLVSKGQLTPTEVPGSAVNRFARTEVMRFLNKGLHADEGLVARYRRPGLATETDLEVWANDPAARGIFPELIRRLLDASGVTNLKSRTLNQVNSSGWDASCTSPGTTFLPAGELRFEIGTNGDFKAKAQRDYAKRSKTTPDAHEIHLVVVTPRLWSDQSKWVDKKNTEAVFKSVSVLDAHDIWLWLQDFPVVHIWFSSQLGISAHGAMLLSDWWSQFKGTLRIDISEGLFLAGRERSKQLVIEFLQDGLEGGQLTLESANADDLKAFANSVVSQSGIDSQTVVLVSEGEALARVLRSSESLVVVLPVRFEAIFTQNLRRHKAIYLADSVTQYSIKPAIQLEPLPLNRAIEELKKTVLEDEDLVGLALVARKSMSAFFRAIALDPRASVPAWVSEPRSANLITLLSVVGRWESSDQAWLESVVGLNMFQIEEQLTSLSGKSDPPYVKVGGIWAPVFLENLLHITGGRLNESILMTLFERFKVEIEQGRISKTAISGIMKSLIIRVIEHEDRVDDSSALALYKHFSNWLMKYSFESDIDLSQLHPLFAEAEPDEYLFLYDDQEFLGTVIAEYFPNEARPNENRYINILWALELLARSTKYFIRAGVAISRLHSLAQRSRLANKPMASLKALCLPQWTIEGITPQTKIDLLNAILDENPSIAWELILELWPSQHVVMIPPRNPIFRSYPKTVEPTPQHLWLEFEFKYLQLVSPLLLADETRWPAVIGRLDDVQTAHRDELLHQLQGLINSGFTSSEAKYSVWTALHGLINRHTEAAGATWVFPKDVLDQVRSLLKQLEPLNEPRKYTRLFSWDYEFANAKGDFKAVDATTTEEQKNAALEVAKLDAAALVDFALACERPEKLGHVLADVTALDSKQVFDLVSRAEDKTRIVILTYFEAKSRIQGFDWLVQEIQSLPEEQLQKVLVRALPLSAEGISAVSRLATEIQSAFWLQVSPYGYGESDAHFVASRMLDAGNIDGALVVASNYLETNPLEPESMLEIVATYAGNSESRHAIGSMATYHLGKILAYLETTNVEAKKIAELEFLLFDALHDHEPSGALYDLLNSSADDLVNLCMLFIDAETESSFGAGLEPTARAGIAYGVYHNWRGMPGATISGQLVEASYFEWVLSARDSFDRIGRLDLGDEILGQISAKFGNGSDTHWPSEPVRSMIEKLKSERFENGLYIGKSNQRGVTTRGVTDGGDQERALAEQFTTTSELYALKLPRTARILRQLAAKYVREAEYFDADAERFTGDF